MSKILDGVMGHAIGDALGVPVEFMDRRELIDNPVTELKDFGERTGWFSDDTSMEIATISSFIKHNSFDYDDIMNNFVLWVDKGEFTHSGYCFDVGRTCLSAISYYRDSHKNPLECGLDGEYDNGNGSLMRILPVVFYCYYKKCSESEVYELVKNISSLTHKHEISILACFIYTIYLFKILDGYSKYDAYNYIKNYDYHLFSSNSLSYFDRILKSNIYELDISSIKSTGYVVDTLEAVFWSILTTDNYKDSVLKAVNLGGDTDTIAAITGSITGIIYGYDSIPCEWLNKLARRDYLEELSLKFENSIK